MKILKVIIVFVACLSLNTYSSEGIKNDLTQYNIKGKVRSVKYTVFLGTEKFGEFQKQGVKNIIVSIFNEKGFTNMLIKYNSDGSLISKSIFKYDSKGNNIEINSYNSDGSLREKFIYKYNDINNKIEENKYNSSGSLVGKIIHKYNNKGNNIESNSYNSDGSSSGKNTFKYDAYDNKIESYQYHSSENKYSTKWTFKYDSKGNKIEENMYSSNGDLVAKSIYKYYANGNPFEEYHSGVFDNSKTTYTYDYDKIGNWIKKNTFEKGIQTGYTESEIEYY